MNLTETVYLPSQLKTVAAPQVALAGRSNVGKSTLVNTLGQRKGLAKISATPGKTRSLNFYHVRPGDFYLVDLPGYGYARCAKSEREKWATLIDVYLRGNPWLRAVAAVVDCRLPPQALDLDLLAYASAQGVPTLVVLTKADKCTQREREMRKKIWTDILGAPPLLFSGKTGLGREALWTAITAMAFSDREAGEKPGNVPAEQEDTTGGRSPGASPPLASSRPTPGQAPATPGVRPRKPRRRRGVRAKI
ncbi:MAG: ribosome biogenesis GTP-binding protein YihA/YsxC [Thermodesulfobacteriota bacterium]